MGWRIDEQPDDSLQATQDGVSGSAVADLVIRSVGLISGS